MAHAPRTRRVWQASLLAWLCLGALPFSLPSPGEQHFLLARHGQTTFNAEKRFQGSMNEEPVLTAKGQEQAKELGKWLKGRAIGTVFVSPLLRAQQTLELAKQFAGSSLDKSNSCTLQELREIDLYEWEGLTQDEVRNKTPEQFRQWKEEAWKLCISEHFVVQDLWKRASQAWALMRKAAPEEKASLIVAHGTLGKALLATALGLPEQAFRHFAIKNGEVVEVAFPLMATSTSSTLAETKWRKLHPIQGPWRGLADEQQAMDNADSIEEVDAA